MTRACTALALALLFPCAVEAAQGNPMKEGTGSISGRVITSDTGKPIRGVHVEIVTFNSTDRKSTRLNSSH